MRQKLAHLLSGVALAAPSLSMAADLSALDRATAVMNECASIAQVIASTPVPENHANARLVLATNKKLRQADASVRPEPVASIHAEYQNWILGATQKLGECGQNYQQATQQVSVLVAQLRKSPPNAKDAAGMAAKFQAHHNAQAALANQIVGLSQHPQIQSYTHSAVQAHFLGNPANGQ